MKNLLLILTFIGSVLIVNPQLALAQQRGGEHATPPDPNNIHLFNRALNTSGYGGTPVGEIHLMDSQIPGSSPFISFGIFTNQTSVLNLYSFGQTVPSFGGPYNDRAASVAFTGDCKGVYRFYDSQDGDISDDWTFIYVMAPIPAGKTYHVWSLDADYTDDYVQVEHHHVNGLLSGKLSRVEIRKSQTL
jgi:hypothetical protein